MIAYFRCLCGANKQNARELRSLGYEIRVVSRSPDWRREAKQIGAKLPFKVTNGNVEEL